MALSAIIDSLDGLSDTIKSEYKKISDGDNQGKFLLDVTGVNGMSLNMHEGAVNALTSERGITKELKEKLSAYKMNGTDITAQQAIDAITKMKNFDPADKDAIKKAIEDEVRSGFEQKEQELIKKYDADTNTLKEGNDKLRTQLHRELVTSRATKALSDRAPDAVSLLLPHVESQVKVVDNDDGSLSVIVKNDEGGTRLTSAAGKSDPMTLDELVEEMSGKTEFSKVFAGSGAQGGGNKGGTGGNKSTDSSDNLHGAQLLAHERAKG